MSLRSGRILVVDDDPASCELVAYFLKSLGYRVAIAADGVRALNMDLDGVELVILDVHMPFYSGPEVLARLRQKDGGQSVKAIALTSDESDEAHDAMTRMGIDGFLTKPVDFNALGDAVTRLAPGMPSGEGILHRRAHKRVGL